MFHLDQELAKVKGARFFCTVDVANGFWTMKVDPVHQYKLAFSLATANTHGTVPIWVLKLTC